MRNIIGENRIMNRGKNIGINAILNVTKQALSVLFPLITYPYAFRILKAEGIGKVSYTQSIISYFSLIAMMGVATYAVREGAKKKDDRKAFNKFVNEVFTINIVFTLISYAFLFVTIIFIPQLHDYNFLLLLQSLSIILTTLSVDWINTVYEDFWLITLRSIISHIISLCLLFAFVHNSNDYYIYALLTVVSNGLTCITNWFYCRRYANIRLTHRPNVKLHLKPLIILFANAVAISVYVNFDTTMLGWIKGDYYVGLYAISVKIYTIIKNIMVAIYAVALPRLAYYIGNNKSAEYKKIYSDLWGYLSLLLIPTSIGVICIASEIMQFMGGEEFINSTLSLQILAIALIFAIFGGLITACLNVTLDREKDNLIATVISAFMNCGLNLFFIPLFAHYGAAFTTLISEAFVFFFCFIRIPNKHYYMDMQVIKKALVHAIVGSVGIIVYSLIVQYFIQKSLWRMVTIVVGSIFLYVLILLLFKDDYIKSNVNKVLDKINCKNRVDK